MHLKQRKQFNGLIHSFPPRICTPPLQDAYSEILPAQPQLKNKDLSDL